MSRRIQRSLFVLLLACTTNVLAQEDESYTSYEALVNELKASAEETPLENKPELNWEDVAIHAGMGVVTSFVSITSPSGVSGAGMLKGFEAFVATNLFTRKARAEFAFRNFAPENLGQDLHADLKGLDLRAVFLPSLDSKTVVRMGLGLSARYMDLDANQVSGSNEYSISTPTSVVLVGFERRFSPAVSVGPDISYRSALISNTYDKSAWDAAIRLNATF